MSPSLKDKLIKVAEGTAIAAGGAALTYLAGYVSSADFSYGPGVAALVVAVLNAAKQALDHLQTPTS